MIDKQILRNDPDKLKSAINNRNSDIDVDAILRLDKELRSCIQELEQLNQEKNQANTEVVQLKSQNQDTSVKIAEMKTVSQKIGEFKQKVEEKESELSKILLLIPNIPSDDTPPGLDPSKDNVVIKTVKEDEDRGFALKDHVSLAESLDLLDFKRSAKVSGSSFIVFKGAGARLERALINFMLDTHAIANGYTEVSTPFIVKRKCMEGTGQLPKFEEDMYRIYRGDADSENGNPDDKDLFLIPTAEVPVTNLNREETLSDEALPIAYVAYTPCFRLEAGAYGKETRGMIRVHQFDKVELVRICKPQDSVEQHELLLGHATGIFDKLGIPYRVVQLCSGDLGFAASKCYDIEVWAPGTGQWLEASSCSNFTDFQARRAGIKFKGKSMKKPQLTHTLNGSGVALARTFIALIENYQQADGSILIPEALRPYMGGDTHIGK